jgi:hypothetical protein
MFCYLTFGRDLSLQITERTDYTMLQFIGDVSALYSALHSIALFLLSYVFHFEILIEDFLINRIFRLPSLIATDNFKIFRPEFTYRKWLQSIFCYFCCCISSIEKTKFRIRARQRKAGLLRISK